MIEVLYTFYSTNQDDYDPDNYVSSFVGRILVADNGDMERRIQVGELTGYLLHLTYAREKHENLYHIFDDHSPDLANYFRALFDRRKNDYRHALLSVPVANDDMLVVDDLIIYPKHRGQNLGLKALMNAIKTFGLTCGVVLCQALPLQYHESIDIKDFKRRIGTKLLFVDKKVALQKIVAHLGKLGFSRVKDSTLCFIETATWDIGEREAFYA